jgi:predicted ATPase
LRAALRAEPGLIRTVSGRGYQFTGEIRLLAQNVRERPSGGAAAAGPVLALSPSNLPEPVSELIGRDDEIRECLSLATEHRLVTLTGAGGIGKTRLAVATAHRMLPEFADGIWLVEFSPLADPGLVPAALATAIGLELPAGEITTRRVARALAGLRILLVLDTCEHVIDAAAEIAESLLKANARLHLIATSREPLRAEGERVYPVPPLAVPGEGTQDDGSSLRYGGVRLFLERARAVKPRFAPEQRQAAMMAAICRRLDGIPLAIELAAARAATLGIEELGARIDDRFNLLAGGRRTALPRHQTLRATLDWSHDLLSEVERIILRRLAVFAGAFNFEAAAAAASGPDIRPSDVFNGLANLVTKSLVAADFNDAEARYRLLDTARAYALDKLLASGELAAMARRLAEHYRQRLLNVNNGDEASLEVTPAWAADLANIRAVLDWAAPQTGDRLVYIGLTMAAVPLWMQLSLLAECRSRVNEALRLLDGAPADTSDSEMILRAALGLSLMYTRGPIQETEAIWERVLEIAESVNNTEFQLRALYGLWLYKVLICEYRAALELAQRFREVAEKGAATSDIATAERLEATVLHYLGDQLATRACALRSLDALPPANRRFYTTHYSADQRAGAFVLLARSLWLLGMPDQAMQAAQAGVDEAVGVGHANSLCIALADGASVVAILIGAYESAETFELMLARHADRHALDVWRTYARALRGRLLLNRDPTAGSGLLRSALADLRGTPFDIRFQLYLVWLAETLDAAGQKEEALAAINEAQERSERAGERWYLPELLRLRGELVLQQGSAEAAADCFARSLREARDQGATSWELRTAMSLAKSQPRQSELLKSVLDRFSEGLATADLVSAQRLLAKFAT